MFVSVYICTVFLKKKRQTQQKARDVHKLATYKKKGKHSHGMRYYTIVVYGKKKQAKGRSN